MKYRLFFLLYLSQLPLLLAQVTFQKKLPSGLYFEIESYADGSLLISKGLTDCSRLFKLNPQGEVAWARQSCLNGWEKGSWISGFAIAPNQETWAISRQAIAQDEERSYLVRFDANGSLLQNTFLPDFLSDTPIANRYPLVVDRDNNAWFLGNIIGTAGYDNGSKSVFSIFRADAATNTVWRKNITLRSLNRREYWAFGLLAVSADDIWVYGASDNKSIAGFIICLNRNGEVKWAKEYDKIYINSIRSTYANGDVLIAGNLRPGFVMARLRPDGSIVWAKRRPIRQTSEFYGTPYLSFDRQHLWLVASANRHERGLSDTAMLYRMDEAGNVQFGKGFAACKYKYVPDGVSTPDNGFALLWWNQQGSVVVSKVNAAGQLNNGCPEPVSAPFLWENIALDVKNFPVTIRVETGVSPQPGESLWESVALATEDFCPDDDYPESSFNAPDSVCLGETLSLMADTSRSADAYYWASATGIPSTGNSERYNVAFTNKGASIVQLVAQSGFCTDTLTQRIEAVGVTAPRIADTVVCDQSSLRVNVTTAAARSYQWSDGDSTPVRTLTRPGLYAVHIRDASCAWRDTFSLAFFKAPDIFGSADTTVCDDAIIGPATNADNIVEWRWNGKKMPLPLPVTVIEAADSLYTVVVSFLNGCSVRDSLRLKVAQCNSNAHIYIPNAISLQETSANRIFTIFAPYATPVSSAIYDRWGGLIYSTDREQWPQWDGTFRGKPVVPGVYVFICTLKFLDGSERVLKSDLTVFGD